MSDTQDLHKAVVYLALISSNNRVDHLFQDWGVPGFEVVKLCNQPNTKCKYQIPKVNTKYQKQIPAVWSKLVFSPPIGHAVLIFVDGTWLGKNYFSSVWIPCKRQIMSLLYLTLGKQAGAMCVVASKPVPSRNRMAKLFLWLLRSKSGCLSIAATSTSWYFNYH